MSNVNETVHRTCAYEPCGKAFMARNWGPKTKRFCTFRCRESAYEAIKRETPAAKERREREAYQAGRIDSDLPQVEAALMNFFGVTKEDLESSGRYFEVKYVRWIVWKIMTSWGVTSERALKQWGHDYDHTTMRNAMNRLEWDMRLYAQVKEGYELVKAYDEDPINLKGVIPSRRFERRVSIAYLQGKRAANRQRKAA